MDISTSIDFTKRQRASEEDFKTFHFVSKCSDDCGNGIINVILYFYIATRPHPKPSLILKSSSI